jgi:diacylglycerol kinase (ATP)
VWTTRQSVLELRTSMTQNCLRKVLVLVNPKSGVLNRWNGLQRTVERCWDVGDIDLKYQFSKDVADGQEKARRAVRDGVDTVLVAGGDGTVSSVGQMLIGTDVVLGVIPTGSGNGFARHFGIPLSEEKAVEALAKASVLAIDVGFINEMPFLVTSSMAWDASLVRHFERMPVRGILPYVMAGVHEWFEYRAQSITIEMDDGETFTLTDPLVVTVANLTQYGGGARIAPSARADDERLELVTAVRRDAPKLLANIGRLFDGTINQIPELQSRRFRSLTMRRPCATPIQIDGELVEAPEVVKIRVQARGLKVLVPC